MTIDELIERLQTLQQEHGKDLGISIIAGDYHGIIDDILVIHTTGPSIAELHCTDEVSAVFPPAELPDDETSPCGYPLRDLYPDRYN